MEGRVSRLEDQLALALDELRQARSREISMQSWAREMVVHLGQVERGEFARDDILADFRNVDIPTFV